MEKQGQRQKPAVTEGSSEKERRLDRVPGTRRDREKKRNWATGQGKNRKRGWREEVGRGVGEPSKGKRVKRSAVKNRNRELVGASKTRGCRAAGEKR